MFAVTVEFRIKPNDATQFHDAVLKQARRSLEREPGCRQFDVCLDPDNPAIVFLYEVYDDAKTFDDHVQTEHFHDFDRTVTPWVEQKTVRRWQRVE